MVRFPQVNTSANPAESNLLSAHTCVVVHYALYSCGWGNKERAIFESDHLKIQGSVRAVQRSKVVGSLIVLLYA